MDKIAENIIAIRKRDISKANEAFADFMTLTEKCLNDKVKGDHRLYKDCGGRKMEPVALDALRKVAPQTPFRPEEIKLVSGAKFPDIQAGQYYGVEVKTTLKDSWKSLGSSIVESTRIEDVSTIYMLFAKLGGEFAEFRCKPYEDCMEDFGITHQPRYRIDREIQEKHRETIFQKMKMDYNTFRLKSEEEKNELFRHFKLSAKKDKEEMAWRLVTEESDYSMPMTVSFFKDQPDEDKVRTRARMFVLFPEVFCGDNQAKYKRAALWLCSRNGLICPNMRDIFSSGGKVKTIGSQKFEDAVSKIFLRLYECRDEINSLLSNPDREMQEDMNEFWPLKTPARLTKDYWLGMVQENVEKNDRLCNLQVSDILDKW